MKLEKGSIVLVPFDPSVGREIKKIRPAVIFQNNLATKYSPFITLIPFSSKAYTGAIYQVPVLKDKENNLLEDSILLVNQIMTFDKVRIQAVLGKVNEEILKQIQEKIDIHMGRKET